MTSSFYDTQDFYKKMLELQEKLRRSEEERMKLEERFNLLCQDSRNRREACINKLRMRYIDFLEEQRLREERNHKILGALDKIDGSLARMTARTNRLGILRNQYEAYLVRVYANRSATGGTGDSGVGSHDDNKSAKFTVSQTEKERPSIQSRVTQSAGSLPVFIPQTNYPQSHIGATNISDFNIARHIQGHDTIPQVNVMRTHGQGDCPAIAQPPDQIPQQFYGSQFKNLQNTLPSNIQFTGNPRQEFLTQIGENYPQQFSQINYNPLGPNSAQIQHHQISDNPDQRSRYIVDQSMMRSRNFLDNPKQAIIPPDLQSTVGLQPEKTNVKTLPDFSTDFTNQTLGPYRHSTPLPGYLDYLTGYSRDPSGRESNVARPPGFTKTDLENVIHRNEKILTKDYLHNPDTIKPSAHTLSKLASPLDAKLSKDMNSDELDVYINRIRSLHRDNDQSLEALDFEQNTSGDLLNATLSDDGFEPLPQPLPSDSKTQNKEIKIVPKNIKTVLELADDFVAETAGEISKVSDIPQKSVFRQRISEEEDANKGELTLARLNHGSPVTLESDMTLDDLSISATRDDILSGKTSLDPNQTQDTSAIMSDKFKPKFMPPIADSDTPQLNIKDVTKISQNKTVDSSKFPPNKSDQNRVFGSSSEKYSELKESMSDLNVQRDAVGESAEPMQVVQLISNDQNVLPQESEIHEDIEGDKVSLVEEEKPYEKVIDVIKELQPPSLQHYEKNVVEICVADEDNKNKTEKVVTEDGTSDQIPEFETHNSPNSALDGDNAVKVLSQNHEANKMNAEFNTADKKYPSDKKIDQSPNDVREIADEDLQSRVETGAKHEEDYHREFSNDGRNPEQHLLQNQEYDQVLEQSYHPNTNEPADYDMRQTEDESNIVEQPYTAETNDPYDSNQIYDTDQQYETNPGQQYSYDANEHSEGDPNGHYEAGSNEQYVDHSNKQFAVDPNEQYAADQNEQYATDPNEQYAAGDEQYAIHPDNQYVADPTEQYSGDLNQHYITDPSGQYTADPNEQYATDPNESYVADPNEQYAADTNEQYAVDPNEQYGYYQNDPNATYENTDENYQQDSNQQYEHDPYQQYEHDPNESYPQDSNEGYINHEYEQNQSQEPVNYEEGELAENQELKNDPDLESTNENHPTVASEKENEVEAAASDLHVQEMLDPGETKVDEDSAELGKKKDKDVIKALLESDTESTIERNPSNNTESDFDFN